MRLATIALFLLIGVLFGAPAAVARPVLLVSIDGLRPGDVTFAEQRGLKIPTLRTLAREGAWAEGVRGVLPTITYPSHTTLLTGVWPIRHGVAGNLPFDPEGKDPGAWYWFYEDVKVPTLWDAAHAAGLKVANVHWPVSVGARAIDLNLPQLWQMGGPNDRKLNRLLATPGLLDGLEAELGPYPDGEDESVPGDEVRARFAARLIARDRPDFSTVYLTGLDTTQHEFGPDTPQAHAALERIDAALAQVIATARAARPDTVVVVVSDHGFAAVTHEVNLFRAFADAGLLTLTAKGAAAPGWRAVPWPTGGSAEVVLAHPEDAAVRARVEALLTRLTANPDLGVAGWIPAADVARMGGAGEAAYFVNLKIGYGATRDVAAPLVGPGAVKGTHGYFPAAPEMRSTFIIAGPGVIAHGSLGEVDMRDIAPTLARQLGVPLPTADGKPLF